MKLASLRLRMLAVPLRITLNLSGPFWSFNWFVVLIKTYAFLFTVALKRPKSLTIKLDFLSRSFSVTLRSSVELALIREVFLDHEYAHPLVPGAVTVFDVGANIGMASIYLACLYPDATVYAFESAPAVYARLVEQVRAFPQIVPCHMALSGTDGERVFYIHPDSILSGSLIERIRGQEQVTIPARRISTMADEFGIDQVDVLKFDIEGGERELFASAEDRARVNLLFGEVHLDILKTTKEEFAAQFPEFDTRYTRRINDNRYLFLAKRLKEGAAPAQA
jgi:FkbM family methyltransferase